MSTQITRIGLVMTHGYQFCREILQGVREFAELRPHWVLTPASPTPDAIRALAKVHPAGIIAHVYSRSIAQAIRDLRKPFINVSGMMRQPLAPRVGNDDVAGGRLAAEHLVNRGFQIFGFVGTKEQHYSCCREQGFCDAVRERGHRVHIYHEPPGQPLDLVGRTWLMDRKVSRWLTSLPRPIGIFTCGDDWGLQLTEVCRQIGLQVPEDVSIVGFENDELLCSLARPSLSSVQPSSRRIGLTAAQVLDGMLRGAAPPREPVLLAPTNVVLRRSSDALVIHDEDVAAAVRFIRDSSHRPVHVRDILVQVPVSRRSLERRFRTVLGRSILHEIRRVHIERACTLLRETNVSIPAVAESSGFSDAKQLWQVFRQQTGQTPTAYRKAVKAPLKVTDVSSLVR